MIHAVMIEQEWLHYIFALNPCFQLHTVPSERWTPTYTDQIWAKGLMPSHHHGVAFHDLRGNQGENWENMRER